MTTTYSHSTLDSQPSFDWKAALAEPFLIVATSAFWLVTLPFAALAVFSVKIWDTMTGIFATAGQSADFEAREHDEQRPIAGATPLHEAGLSGISFVARSISGLPERPISAAVAANFAGFPEERPRSADWPARSWDRARGHDG